MSDLNNGAADRPVFFYWEQGGSIDAEPSTGATEDEGGLANELIRGADLLLLPIRYRPRPPAVNIPSVDREGYAFVDAIAAILQVAVWEGHDARQIVDRSLQSQRLVRDCATNAARARQRA